MAWPFSRRKWGRLTIMSSWKDLHMLHEDSTVPRGSSLLFDFPLVWDRAHSEIL